MTNRNKLVAGIGGAALVAGLVGMGSFALWSDNAATDAGVVTAGTLEVANVGMIWDDISTDLPETPIVNIDAWKVVPGDTLELKVDLDVALEGENLAAELDISELENALVDANVQGLVTLDATLAEADGTPVSPEDGAYRFSSATAVNGGQELGGVEAPATLDGTRDVTATVVINVSETASADELKKLELADFTDTGVSLTQVRDGRGFTEAGGGEEG